jgi:hypothetical protein
LRETQSGKPLPTQAEFAGRATHIEHNRACEAAPRRIVSAELVFSKIAPIRLTSILIRTPSMRNVFMVYMPLRNTEAMMHYEDTIKRKVSLDRISRFIPSDLRARLQTVFGHHPIAVWGSVAGQMNRSFFAKMSEGDDLLIVEGDSIKLIGKIVAKTINADLSGELWRPVSGKSDTRWELIYFIANPRELNVPFSQFCKLFGYAENYQLRGFSAVADQKVAEFYEKYDDLYSILVRLKAGEQISQRTYPTGPLLSTLSAKDALTEVGQEDIEQVLASEIVSDHVKMQWKLASLGLKAGERVWVPVADQGKLRRLYEFNTFDPEFASGIDLPHSYVENIDVVWKQEYRIDAAYEIENSTAIYSGLLRFADLMILAPNTLYPMFIVAPAAKRNRVREQLRRPTFLQMKLDSKVKFLSYEALDEIDNFFSGANAGLSVDLIAGKAERIT